MNYILLYIFLSSYIDDGNELKQANVFTMIALFGYLTDPFNMLPWALSYMAEARISYNRTQRFMNEPEIDVSNSKLKGLLERYFNFFFFLNKISTVRLSQTLAQLICCILTPTSMVFTHLKYSIKQLCLLKKWNSSGTINKMIKQRTTIRTINQIKLNK